MLRATIKIRSIVNKWRVDRSDLGKWNPYTFSFWHVSVDFRGQLVLTANRFTSCLREQHQRLHQSNFWQARVLMGLTAHGQASQSKSERRLKRLKSWSRRRAIKHGWFCLKDVRQRIHQIAKPLAAVSFVQISLILGCRTICLPTAPFLLV